MVYGRHLGEEAELLYLHLSLPSCFVERMKGDREWGRKLINYRGENLRIRGGTEKEDKGISKSGKKKDDDYL